MKKKPSVQRAKREARSSHEPVLPKGGEPLAANQVYSDHNNHVAYFPLDVLEGSEGSEGGIHFVNHEYINPTFWSDYTHPESQTKKTKGHLTREKDGRLAGMKSILAASTRHDWEACGPRLWVRKGDAELIIVDLTNDDGRVELEEE